MKEKTIEKQKISNALLLTLTCDSIPGGVEVYSNALRRVIPSLRILGRENVKSLPAFPFLSEAMLSISFAHELNSLEQPPAVLFTNGIHGWALPHSIPTISILHGTYAGFSEAAYPRTSLQYWRMRHIFSFLEKKSAQKASLCVANSQFTQHEARKYYGVKSRIIYPPIDTHLFKPGPKKEPRRALKWNPSSSIVLFVGNPIYSKGWDVVQSLAMKNPTIEFHCICVPSIKSPLPNMRIYSAVPHSDLVNYYRAADVVVFPSRYEGFGFVPLEAMASGCPVIASPVGVLNEFQPKGLVLVRNHSVESFQNTLNSVLAKPFICSAREKIADRFSVERFAQGFSKLMEEL